MGQAELEERLFELIGYMLVSGRNLLDETPLYGPFRLVDAASRLIAILEEEELASSRLSAIRKQIDAGKYSVMTQTGGFRTFLDALVDALVEHMDSQEKEVINGERKNREKERQD